MGDDGCCRSDSWRVVSDLATQQHAVRVISCGSRIRRDRSVSVQVRLFDRSDGIGPAQFHVVEPSPMPYSYRRVSGLQDAEGVARVPV